MHVHIDVLRCYLDPEIDRGTIPGMDRPPVSRLCCADEKRVTKRPAIHEQLGSPPGGLRVTGTLDISADPKRAGRVLHRHQRSRQLSSPHCGEPLRRILSGGHTEPASAVDLELEPDFGVSPRGGGHSFVNGACLAGGRAKEFSAGWGIEEEAADSDRRASLTGNGSYMLDPSTRNLKLRPLAISVMSRECQARYRGDGRQRFTAKAEGGNAHEIGCRPDFAGGVTVQRQDSVLPSHSAAVITNLDQHFPAVFHGNPDMAGGGGRPGAPP